MERELTTVVAADVAQALSSKMQSVKQATAATPLRGSVLVMIQFDVCEEIRLDVLRNIFGARTEQVPFKNTAPSYVRYQRTPVVETMEPLTLDSGERLEGQIKYFDYGVVSLVFELPFAGDWDDLIQLSCRWTSDPNFESLASHILRQKLERAAPALIKPYDPKANPSKPDGDWLQEDYFIFHVREIDGATTTAASDLLAAQGEKIAQIVRGEMATLSEGERQEILQSRISYYPNDLAVIGWNAAFIYDTPAGAETAIQLLQYANSQLLEFRHYDESAHHRVGKSLRLSRCWRHRPVVALADGARRLETAHRPARRERTDRARRQRHQVPQRHVLRAALQTSCQRLPKSECPTTRTWSRKLVHRPILDRFMVEQFNQSRAFVLELMVVVILIS